MSLSKKERLVLEILSRYKANGLYGPDIVHKSEDESASTDDLA